MTQKTLHQFLDLSAQRHPNRVAVKELADGMITYSELSALSDRLRDRLYHLGVRPGDRVGLYVSKSIDAVASIFGVLKAGAAYVPVDPSAPTARNAYILNDCAVKIVIMEKQFEEGWYTYASQNNESPGRQTSEVSDTSEVWPIHLLVLHGTGCGKFLNDMLMQEKEKTRAATAETVIPSPDDLAYILYTSGSTGKPKGVMLSHRHATGFIDWCSGLLKPTEEDCFSSHAPFHFDLSILDVFTSMKHGATLVLIDEKVGKDPIRLASDIADNRITIWYSTPSILALLAQYGKMDRHDYSALRAVLFAGEVFPVKHLRDLKSLLPDPTYYNLYGPTETNVCTFYEIPYRIPEERTQPFPIGKACAHVQTSVVDEQGQVVPPGQEGELCVSGPAVMKGYWNLPEQTTCAMFVGADGQRWYKTGDIVLDEGDGNYVFVGRRDRMVKKRGYRIELGEIELALYRHPEVKEAAVIAVLEEQEGVHIKAFLSCREGGRLSIIRLKRFCAEHLPLYMVPDSFSFYDSLPKTSTDKIDYQRLIESGRGTGERGK